MIRLAVLMLLVSGFTFRGEENKLPFHKWTKAELEKANTAKDVKGLSEDEKQFIFYTNLVRINPSLFCETYLQRYLDDTKQKKNEYVKSLQKQLMKCSSLTPLKHYDRLTELAKEHSVIMGEKGLMGHDQPGKKFRERFRKLIAEGRTVAENCDYGNQDPLEAVISLLIDEGVPDYGHRENILDKTFTYIGVSYNSHKRYGHSYVCDFSS